MPRVVPYAGMPPRKWFPETPQLLKDVWMLIARYRANPDALQAALPPGLDPHPDSLVRMNMYVVPDGRQTSGFGPYSLTYLTVELAGHDSWVAEGTMPVPGTFFVYYWNSSERVRRYTREAAGIPALPGSCTWQREGDKLVSTLTVDDQPVIRAVASVTDNLLMPLGGHLNYYSHRQFGAPEGGRAVVSELLEFPLPFVMDLYEATVQEIEFSFPEGDPAAELSPVQPLDVPAVLYGPVTFTYSMGRRIRDYLAEGNPT